MNKKRNFRSERKSYSSRKAAAERERRNMRLLTLRAAVSGVLVVFAVAAANLSFLSYARDSLNTAVNENISLDTVKTAGRSGLENLKLIKDNAVAAFVEKDGNTDKAEQNENTKTEEEPVIKIAPPESFLPEQE